MTTTANPLVNEISSFIEWAIQHQDAIITQMVTQGSHPNRLSARFGLNKHLKSIDEDSVSADTISSLAAFTSEIADAPRLRHEAIASLGD